MKLFKGFTLIELIVVIAIIAILAAIIAPNAFKAIEKAKMAGTVSDFDTMKTASMSYYSDTGQWPATCTSVAACSATSGFVTTNNMTGWDGPYMEKWPGLNKWGGAYNWTNATGQVFCTGAGCAAAGERYLTIANVPQSAVQKIDMQIEGGATASGTTGRVRYANATTTTMNVMVSRDGPTD